MCLLCHCPISKSFARLFLQFCKYFVTRNAKLSKFINNENFCKKEKKEIDRSRDVTGMVDNMHSNLTRSFSWIATVVILHWEVLKKKSPNTGMLTSDLYTIFSSFQSAH